MNRWTMRLIIANVAMYVLSLAAPGLMNATMLVPAYALVRPWTLVTYMFMHASPSHILFNMLGLFFFGPRVEDELGGARFLWLYFISGFTGAVLSFFFTPFAAIVGASGAIYGVLLAFAYLWPRERIFIWGIIPIEARWLVVGMTALSLFGGYGGEGNIAHFAHLGGFVGAYVYLKLIDRHIHRDADDARDPRRRRIEERRRSLGEDRPDEAPRSEPGRTGPDPDEDVDARNRKSDDAGDRVP